MSENVAEIKGLLEKGKLVIGAERTLKELRRGKLTTIYLSSNCNSVICNDIENTAKINSMLVVRLLQTSDELGTICRKQFGIQALGVLSSHE